MPFRTHEIFRDETEKHVSIIRILRLNYEARVGGRAGKVLRNRAPMPSVRSSRQIFCANPVLRRRTPGPGKQNNNRKMLLVPSRWLDLACLGAIFEQAKPADESESGRGIKAAFSTFTEWMDRSLGHNYERRQQRGPLQDRSNISSSALAHQHHQNIVREKVALNLRNIARPPTP